MGEAHGCFPSYKASVQPPLFPAFLQGPGGMGGGVGKTHTPASSSSRPNQEPRSLRRSLHQTVVATATAQDAQWPTAPSLAAERQLSGGAGYQSFSPLKRKKLDFLRDLRGQSNQSKGWGVRRQLGRRPATQGYVCSDLSQGPTSQQGDSGQTFIG